MWGELYKLFPQDLLVLEQMIIVMFILTAPRNVLASKLENDIADPLQYTIVKFCIMNI